jgi:hypothetical protein
LGVVKSALQKCDPIRKFEIKARKCDRFLAFFIDGGYYPGVFYSLLMECDSERLKGGSNKDLRKSPRANPRAGKPQKQAAHLGRVGRAYENAR